MELASKSNNFHYNKELRDLARKNRTSMTKSSACMWKYLLSGRQILGYKFRRERPILNFIVDFVCFDLMLVIEVDGASHESPEAVKKDKERDELLHQIGFSVLRFGSWEVLNRIGEVDEILYEWIKVNAKVPPPNPRQKRRAD